MPDPVLILVLEKAFMIEYWIYIPTQICVFEMTHDDCCHRSAWHWGACICLEEVGKTLEEVTFDFDTRG